MIQHDWKNFQSKGCEINDKNKIINIIKSTLYDKLQVENQGSFND